jgi:hypothetical protein
MPHSTCCLVCLFLLIWTIFRKDLVFVHYWTEKARRSSLDLQVYHQYIYVVNSGSFQNLQSTISEITRLLIYFAQHQSGSMHRFWWRLWQPRWRIPNTASRLKLVVKKSHPLISLLPPTGQQPIKFGVSNRRQLQWLIKIHSWDFWKWAWRTTAWCILTYSNLKSSLQSLQCTDWISGIRKSWWVHFCL